MTNREKTPADLLADLQAATKHIEDLSLERHVVAIERAMTINRLQVLGWSLQQIADAVSLTKNAIAKAAKVDPREHPESTKLMEQFQLVRAARNALVHGTPSADKRITEQVDGTWAFYCPHAAGDVDVKLFPSDVLAKQYAEAHDRVIHGRRFLVQHLDMSASPNGANWTRYYDTLDEALAGADMVYDPANPLIRQEIIEAIDEVTQEWRFRGAGSLEWSRPTRRVRSLDVDMDGLLSTGEQGRRQPDQGTL